MKSLVRPCVFMLIVVLAPCLLSAGEPGPADGAAGETSKIPKQVLDFVKPLPVEGDELHQKLAERHNAAVGLLEARVEQYKKGITDLNSVIDAARAVIEAKLDMAENDDAKVRVLQDSLALAKLIEDRARQVKEKGIGSEADYQRARLGRLTIEVQILKAKRAEKP